MARFKTPERVTQVDAFPLLSLGKPDRDAVRAQLGSVPGDEVRYNTGS